MIRTMKEEDYPKVYKLWKTIKGFGIRSMDDSREGVERFILRNPNTSIVAEVNREIVGSILCGHDGRRGCFYHVCVREDYRKQGIGKNMAVYAMKALQEEHINKVCLIAFKNNETGNSFWKSVGWTFREDLNYYDFILNDENITTFQ
ncbi:MAG: GNAT family N-acetyltransferase [Lachnospiraceae bacterium]